jgi:hypothetical protein
MTYMVQRQGESSWTTLYDLIGGNLHFFDDGSPDGFDGVWFNAYDTNRQANQAQPTWVEYDQYIVSTSAIALPNDLPAMPTVPAWAPAPGAIAAVSLNTMSSIDPCPGNNCVYSGTEGQSGVLNDWNGGAWARDLGTRGSMIKFGGGHSGYLGNEVYRYDVETRLWSRLSDPTTNIQLNSLEGEYQPGIPMSNHTYGTMCWLPPHVAGNDSGWFVRPVSASNGYGGSEEYSGRAHRFDLDAGTWARLSTNRATMYGGFQNECCAVWDPKRQLIWMWTQGNIPVQMLGPSTNWAWQNGSTNNQILELDACAAYCPWHDRIYVFANRNDQTVYIFNPNSPNSGLSNTSMSGTRPSMNGTAIYWDDRRHRFVAWDQSNRQRLYYLTINEQTPSTVVWSFETLTGATIPSPGPIANPPYNQPSWCESADCMLVHTLRTGSVYALRPTSQP